VRQLRNALERGTQTLVGDMLGITRDGLRYKIRKYGMVSARTRAARP
jgi:DNA-binding protein Fis